MRFESFVCIFQDLTRIEISIGIRAMSEVMPIERGCEVDCDEEGGAISGDEKKEC